MIPARRLLIRAAPLALVLGAVLVLWAALPLRSGAAPTAGEVQSKIDASRSREQSLQSDSARLAALIDRLSGSIARLEEREATVQAQLDTDRAALAKVRGNLRRQRSRVKRLRARLARSKQILAARMTEVYKTPAPDFITVVMSARGFADLIDRAEFVSRVNEQDSRIIRQVRTARTTAQREARRIKGLEVRRARATAAVLAQRIGLASMHELLVSRQASLAEARAAQLAALKDTRSGRRALESQLTKLEAERKRQNTSTQGPSGPWAIPWSIVQCESGGQNFPPNSAGASGYYQIIPSTWSGFGGKGPAAWLASKAEQDRVATLIWAGGPGARNWDCAYIVGYL